MTGSSSNGCSLAASATNDEIDAAQILLDLRTILSLSECLSPYGWIRKRRRSCLDAPPPLPRAPSPPARRTENVIEERRRLILTEEAAAEKIGAARTTGSPDTPLSFSPSETDEKSKHSLKKNSRKRLPSKKDCIKMVEELTEQKESLTGEIENVKKHYQELKAYNSELKAMKQRVQNPLSNLRMNLETESSQQINTIPHHQLFIENPMVCEFSHSIGPIGQLYVNQVGPRGIDLNIPADEGLKPSQPLDMSGVVCNKRAKFAEARRKRRGIMKTKSSRSAALN